MTSSMSVGMINSTMISSVLLRWSKILLESPNISLCAMSAR